MPRASKSVIGGMRDGRLVVRVTAPPVDGAANDAVIALLARTLSHPKGAIRIISGETSRNKTAEIDGADALAVRRALGLP